MSVKVKRYFMLVLLFTIASIATSIFTVTRNDEGDWFSGSRCGHEFSTYEHDIGGCHCYHGLTFSTESMRCRSYKERGNHTIHGSKTLNL